MKHKGSVTEVIDDFVVTPRRATIGLQRSALPERWRPLLYCLLIISTYKSDYFHSHFSYLRSESLTTASQRGVCGIISTG